MSPAQPSGFDVALRFEIVSDEGRALFTSYLVATLLAVVWLALVRVVPRPPMPDIDIPGEPPIIVVVPPPVLVPPPTAAELAGSSQARSDSRGGGGIRAAFGGTAGLVDAGRVLRGVDVTSTRGADGAPALVKVGIGPRAGVGTPGRARGGGLSPLGAAVGAVAGDGVSRSAVAVAAPEVHAVVAGPPGVGAAAVGQAARAHIPQLERCYYDEGLTRNAALAGIVRLAVDVEAGRVTSARIVDRSWAGAGVAETESCLVQSVRGWRLGSSDARIVLPLSFTSPVRAPR